MRNELPPDDGPRPGGAPTSPGGPPDPAPPRRFSDLSPGDQLRVVEILRPGWDRALARYRERKRLEAAEHVRAA